MSEVLFPELVFHGKAHAVAWKRLNKNRKIEFADLKAKCS